MKNQRTKTPALGFLSIQKASLIGPHASEYKTGFDRGVHDRALIDHYGFRKILIGKNALRFLPNDICLKMRFSIRVDFPEPDTPARQTKWFRGIFAFSLRTLWPQIFEMEEGL